MTEILEIVLSEKWFTAFLLLFVLLWVWYWFYKIWVKLTDLLSSTLTSFLTEFKWLIQSIKDLSVNEQKTLDIVTAEHKENRECALAEHNKIIDILEDIHTDLKEYHKK